MLDINKVVISGRLTGDPELHVMPNKNTVTNIKIAINRKWKDKNSGELKTEVSYLEAKAFGKISVALDKYFKKGKPILLEGHLKMEEWEFSGGRRTKHVLIVETFHFID